MFTHDEVTKIKADFSAVIEDMLHLIAQGRSIELLIRIADQTTEGLAAVDESYDAMMQSGLQIKSQHPKQALPNLTDDPGERKQLLAARDIADKLAHGLFRQARLLIDAYRVTYGLQTELNAESVPGWFIDAKGHLLEEDGRRIDSIVDTLSSSDDNLILEEYELFTHNKYREGALEIFETARTKLAAHSPELAMAVARLRMFRGLKRGKRTYFDEQKPD